MVIEKKNSSRRNRSSSKREQETNSDSAIEQLIKDMKTVKEKFRMKDIEINELIGKVTNPQKTIAGQHDCIASLGDKTNQDSGN